ncbi:hypothetical protein Tco_1214659 [Tanacetum coccineum]
MKRLIPREIKRLDYIACEDLRQPTIGCSVVPMTKLERDSPLKDTKIDSARIVGFEVNAFRYLILELGPCSLKITYSAPVLESMKVSDKKGLQVDRESAAISINMSQKWFKEEKRINDDNILRHPADTEPSSLTRGTIPLELVDASTVRSSQKRHGIDEYSSDDEEIDPTNLEFSENEESSQEEYSDSD